MYVTRRLEGKNKPDYIKNTNYQQLFTFFVLYIGNFITDMIYKLQTEQNYILRTKPSLRRYLAR